METSPAPNSPDSMAPEEVVTGFVIVLCVGSALAALFGALDWPVLFGVSVGVTALFALIGVSLLFAAAADCKPSIRELAEQERLARQATAALEAETDQRTAELMRQFLDRLPPDERALLGLRLMAESRVARTVAELEREVVALRAELARGIG